MSYLDMLMDSAVNAIEHGSSFNDFKNNERNVLLSNKVRISLEAIWQISFYVVNTLKKQWMGENS